MTQSRVSQLRAEGLELLREALSRLLEADARAGAEASSRNNTQGARGRRRDAYVDAVARRSTVNRRVDVGRYLSTYSDV